MDYFLKWIPFLSNICIWIIFKYYFKSLGRCHLFTLSFFISSCFLLIEFDFSNLSPFPQLLPAVKSNFSAALCGFWQTLYRVSVCRVLRGLLLHLPWDCATHGLHEYLSLRACFLVGLFVLLLSTRPLLQFSLDEFGSWAYEIKAKVTVLWLNPTNQTVNISKVTGPSCCQYNCSGSGGQMITNKLCENNIM